MRDSIPTRGLAVDNSGTHGLAASLLGTLRWSLIHLIRDPIGWLWLVLIASAWPIIVIFTPLGITTQERTPAAPLYEIAFMALLVGAALGVALMARSRWFLAPLSVGRRLAVEATGLLGLSLTLAGLTLGLALLSRTPVPPRLVLGVLLAALHICAGGILLLRLPFSPPTLALALPLLFWLLPALLEGAGNPGPLIASWLDARAFLAFPLAGNPAPTQSAMPFLPIIAMVLAAGLLHHPDAIRDSR